MTLSSSYGVKAFLFALLLDWCQIHQRSRFYDLLVGASKENWRGQISFGSWADQIEGGADNNKQQASSFFMPFFVPLLFCRVDCFFVLLLLTLVLFGLPY